MLAGAESVFPAEEAEATAAAAAAAMGTGATIWELAYVGMEPPLLLDENEAVAMTPLLEEKEDEATKPLLVEENEAVPTKVGGSGGASRRGCKGARRRVLLRMVFSPSVVEGPHDDEGCLAEAGMNSGKSPSTLRVGERIMGGPAGTGACMWVYCPGPGERDMAREGLTRFLRSVEA